MKYLHYYDSSADFAQNYNNDYTEPYLGYVEGADSKHYNKYRNNRWEYVDLGLPSGTLWAPMNIGATSLDSSGYTFAWGEIENKAEGSWSNYKYGTSQSNITKYNAIDNLSFLEYEDDIAHITMGGNWCIPSSDDFLELISNTKHSRDSGGMTLFTSNINSNILYFYSYIFDIWLNNVYPSASYKNQAYVGDVGEKSGSWRRRVTSFYRYNVFPIRPVLKP